MWAESSQRLAYGWPRKHDTSARWDRDRQHHGVVLLSVYQILCGRPADQSWESEKGGMDISALLRIITEKGSYLAGAALTMCIVLGLTWLGLPRLPETWLNFIIVAGTFSAMVLLSGAVAWVWPKLVCWIQCRRHRKRREEYSIKNFEDLDSSHHHYHALVFIKDRGRQRFHGTVRMSRYARW